jgi:hypothetical protein
MKRHVEQSPATLHKVVRSISILLLLLLGINGMGNSLFPSSAYAAQVSQKCTKVGEKSGSLVCSKINGRLVWQITKKKKQAISAQFPRVASLSTNHVSITYRSTSGLRVSATASSPAVCTIKGYTISFLQIGSCVIHLTQGGSSQYLSAPSRTITITIQGASQISFTPPASLLLSASTYELTSSATSGLPITYQSLTSDICSASESTLTLINVGICTIRALQAGSNLYPASYLDASINILGDNQISFTLPTSLLLSTLPYSLSATAASGLPVAYESLTVDVCSVSVSTLTINKVGVCTIRASQNGSNLYAPANYVDQSVTISSSRVTSDQPDTIVGFQVHAFYVVPSDGVDHSYDTNGYIAGIVDEGNSFIHSQIGYSLPVDRTTTGYDIQYLKSKLSTASIQSGGDLADEMLNESQALDNPGTNRKDYIFFIDVPDLVNSQACGIGTTPGISAVVAIGTGSTCSGNPYNLKNYASSTWLHELFHNFGVNHTLDDPCDLMRGGDTPGACPATSSLTVDKERTRYVNSFKQGQDIMKLRVWEGHTQDMNLQANCTIDPAPRSDGFNYAYCPTGTQQIGALKNCWDPINSASLEEFINRQWTSLGSGSSDVNPWGSQVSWTCGAGFTAPTIRLSVTRPGISLYRWMVNGKESEQFKVIWVN